MNNKLIRHPREAPVRFQPWMLKAFKGDILTALVFSYLERSYTELVMKGCTQQEDLVVWTSIQDISFALYESFAQADIKEVLLKAIIPLGFVKIVKQKDLDGKVLRVGYLLMSSVCNEWLDEFYPEKHSRLTSLESLLSFMSLAPIKEVDEMHKTEHFRVSDQMRLWATGIDVPFNIDLATKVWLSYIDNTRGGVIGSNPVCQWQSRMAFLKMNPWVLEKELNLKIKDDKGNKGSFQPKPGETYL